MTPEERDYEEAKRRIQEAEDNKSVELDLSYLSDLTRFPPELANLTSLQSLAHILFECGGVEAALNHLVSIERDSRGSACKSDAWRMSRSASRRDRAVMLAQLG